MANSAGHEVDREQVKKAADYLLHDFTSLEGRQDLVFLRLDLWAEPSSLQVLYIPLPHRFRPDPCDFTLFTRTEPNISTEETIKFHKELLSQRGVSQEIGIVPLGNVATRRQRNSWQKPCFLVFADAKTRPLVESGFGAAFCDRCVEFLDLESGDLTGEFSRRFQETRVNLVAASGCMIPVGHVGMELEHLVENVLAAAQGLAEKLPGNLKSVKSLSLKMETGRPLPIYISAANRPESSEEKMEGDEAAGEEKKSMKKSGWRRKKKSKAAKEIETSGSGETKEQPVVKMEDPTSAQETQEKAENGETGAPNSARKRKMEGDEAAGEEEKKKKRRRKKKKSKAAQEIETSGSGETKEQPAVKKEDPDAPCETQVKAENGKTGAPNSTEKRKMEGDEAAGEEKKKKKKRRKKKKSKAAQEIETSGSGETKEQPAVKKEDPDAPCETQLKA